MPPPQARTGAELAGLEEVCLLISQIPSLGPGALPNWVAAEPTQGQLLCFAAAGELHRPPFPTACGGCWVYLP